MALKSMVVSHYQDQLYDIDHLLVKYQWLWQPQPFKQARPQWCQEQTELTESLLQLSTIELLRLSSNTAFALDFLSNHIPELKKLEKLNKLPLENANETTNLPAYLSRDIPGRKWQQILAFSNAIKLDNIPIIEWCGGKGHLGRLLSHQNNITVHTLELQRKLCDHGQILSHKSNVKQKFSQLDVMTSQAKNLLVGHHPIALHACGELHRKLLTDCINNEITQLSFTPCCYHLGMNDKEFQPFTPNLKLRPTRDDLRLAVTDTATANNQEIKQRNHEMHWKLGYDQLRRDIRQEDSYRPILPIKKAWLKFNFKQFCQTLAAREQLTLPSDWNEQHYLSQGLLRQHDFFRLSIPRQAFRRSIELWVLLDMCLILELKGYQVIVSQFCNANISPRNVLIQAKKHEPC